MSGKKADDKAIVSQVGALVVTDVVIPLLMIIVAIICLTIGVNYSFFKYNSEDVELAALRLSQSEVKSKDALERVYPDYIIVYYDINKQLITEEGFGNYDYEGVSYSLPSEYYSLVQQDINGVPYLAATHTMSAPYNEKATYVRVYIDLSTSDALKDSILLICSLMIAFVFIVQSLLGIFAVKSQTKPLVRSLERNSRLISDISHEFNTPLAIINTKISAALANPAKKVEDVSEELVSAINETQRLKRMIKEMLILSSSDSNRTLLNMEELDISDLTRDVVEPFAMMCEMDEKEFVDGINDGIRFTTDKDKYRQMLIALLDNALKYTAQGKICMRYRVDEIKRQILISVSDTGIGIPQKRRMILSEIFSIGLAIVKEIVRSLGGKIYVRNNVPHGFIIEIEFAVKAKKEGSGKFRKAL